MSSIAIPQREITQQVQQNLADMGIPSPPPSIVDPPAPAAMSTTAAADLPSD
jgi:hypothetical protein